MRALQRRLQFMFFLFGLFGLLGGSVPVVAQTAGQETLEVDADASSESETETKSTETTSLDVLSPFQLSASADRVETFVPIRFLATGSLTQSASIVSYTWDLDGNGEFEVTSTEPSVSRSFADDGTYEARVQAIADDGHTFVSEPIEIEVLNRPPSATFTMSSAELTDISEVTFEETSSDLDGEVIAWFWDLGDGMTSSQQNPTHTYEISGTYTASLLVLDNDGRASSRTEQTITITNSPPAVSFRAPSTATVGVAVRLVDASLDPSPNGRIVHVGWDFGDGTYEAGGPSVGGAYSHTYTTPGTYTVRLYVIDKDGVLSSAQAQINVLGVL